MKISSIPATPDLYEEDEREENDENQNYFSNDKNTKMRLKVSISETPETVQCSTTIEDVEETEIRKQDENEDQHEVVSEEEGDEKKDVEEINKSKSEEEKEDESEQTGSIQEDISAGRTTEDDEDENTYTIDEK